MTSSQRLGLGHQVGMGGRETGDDGHIGATRRHTHNSHKTLRQLPASSSCSRRQAPRLDARLVSGMKVWTQRLGEWCSWEEVPLPPAAGRETHGLEL